MDYYQGIVAEYLSACRGTFVANEYLLELEKGGPHWWIDVLAISLREKRVYLCEVTFNKQLSKIVNKVQAFSKLMDGIRGALNRDAAVPVDWPVKPWLFVPRATGPVLVRRLQPTYHVRITYLEDVGPWLYPSGCWEREPAKPYSDLPSEYQ